MSLIFEQRLSDSPFIETVWSAHSESAGSFTSRASSYGEMVLMRYKGQVSLTLRGPETAASCADFPADADWFGIRFKLGVYLPHLPPGILRDRRDANLPQASRHTFWLSGSTWQFPEYENADVFAARLAHEDVLACDFIIAAALQDQLHEVSARTLQRHFLHATGLTHNAVRQIERARYALSLLEQNTPILDTVAQAGYFDQPHLTRSLKHLMGITPAQIGRLSQPASTAQHGKS